MNDLWNGKRKKLPALFMAFLMGFVMTFYPVTATELKQEILLETEDKADITAKEADEAQDGEEQTDGTQRKSNQVLEMEELDGVVLEAATETDVEVTIANSGHGTVNKDGEAAGDSFLAAENEEVILQFCPDEGYQIAAVKLDGTDITVDPAAFQPDGSYTYSFTVAQACTVEVSFSEIPSEEKDAETVGFTVTAQASSDGKIYASAPVTVQAPLGKLIRLPDAETYEGSIVISESKAVDSIFMRDQAPSGFGTESKIVLSPKLEVVMDTENPTISLNKEKIYVDGRTEEVRIAGSASDDVLLNRVVYATARLTEAEILAETVNVVTDFDNGGFTTPDLALSGAVLSQFYFYAVDAADHCSQESMVSVYRDTDAPEIVEFRMQAEGSNLITGKPAVSAIEKTSYGFFFKEEATVYVIASDGEGESASGVSKISYYLKSIDSIEKEVFEAEADEDGKIRFIVPKGFKGQIYAKAEDNVGNECDDTAPSGVVVEDALTHGNEPHIKFDPQIEADALYKEDIPIDVTVIDTYSGIQSVEWSVEAPYDIENNQGGSLQVDSTGAFVSEEDAQGWTVAQTDHNLVTELKKSILITNNSNGIVLKVKMTDRAGNSSEDTICFSIDKTSPVISVAFEPASSDGAYEYAYKNLKAVITVKERNFNPNAIVFAGANLPPVSAWQDSINAENPDESVHTAELLFTDEGHYTLEVSGEDLAGNLAEPVKANDFTVDKTAPEIEVLLDTTDAYEETGEEGIRFWYANIPDLSYRVSDKKGGKDGSGISERKAYLNGELLANYGKTYTAADYKNALQEETGALTAESLAMQDGKNVVKVWFSDLAGNSDSSEKELYLDRSAPQITKFLVEKENNSAVGTVLNALTFGAFFNETVTLTVSLEDEKDETGSLTPSSGLKEVTLYLDGEAYQTTPVEAGSKEVRFTLPKETVLAGKEKIYLDKFVAAKVTDNVGNESAITDVTGENSNLKQPHLMIETIKPTIKTSIQKEDYKNEGVIFNNSDVLFGVTAADEQSGLRTVTIQINHTVLVDEHYQGDEKITEESFEVDTKDVPTPQDGWYQMKVTVVDNAGNSTVSLYPENGMYKDEKPPEIVRFEMKAEGTAEANGKRLSYQETDYGYYFLEDTTVSVYASDGTQKSDSGVKEIRYYTVSADGSSSPILTAGTDKEGKIRFLVEANFKGQIYACAWDHVQNSTEKYVTPSGVVIETPKQHKKENHIAIQKEKAPYKDKKGRALYDKNVAVDVTVTDTYSGIRSVEWSVEAPNDTTKNQSGRIELDNEGGYLAGSKAGGWKKTAKDKNLVTELKKTFQVTNDSNDIVLRVKMTDRAGNTSSDKVSFHIDKTDPVIEITFDNESPDPEFKDIYKDDRTATITVKERNFDEDAVKVSITNTDNSIPQLSSWETVANTANPDETEHTATVHFSEDGDYTLEAECHDLAYNPSQTQKADDFTIDKTLPVIAVSYDTDHALNGNYYASERTAVIEITEHNFAPERVQIIGTATDDGREISFPVPGGFTGTGDVHTASIACAADGLYRFDVEYADQAGNEGERYTGEEYYIDMTEPEIEISGVEDQSANNGDVIPVISFTDTNYDAAQTEITLSGVNRGNVEVTGAYSGKSNGQIYTMENFPKEQEYDDLYTLTATLRDKAGNESTESIRFSVNRFGSVYVLDESLKSISGTYIQDEIDVKLSEVNVDSLEESKNRIVVDTNGIPRDLVKGSDYTIKESGGDGNWHHYDYIINKSLFEGDGRYIVTLYSKDAAGNINENIDEMKRAEISFGVDKTAPVVVPIDIESNAQYPVDTKSATVTVNDNLVLDSVEIYIDEKKCEYEADGEGYTFTVPSGTKPQSITIAAMDAAKNRTQYILSGVLVTTNFFVRWYNNKPLFAGSLAGIALLGGGAVGGVAYFGKRRRKREEEE